MKLSTLSSAQKAAKLQAAKAGKYGGGNWPFGYATDDATIVPEERDVLLEMAERIIRGEFYRTIALDLNARGITTSKGGFWRALKVHDVVFRKRNFGIREHLGTDHPAPDAHRRPDYPRRPVPAR